MKSAVKEKIIAQQQILIGELQYIKTKYKKEHPAYAQLKYPEPASIKSVQPLLKTNEALLNYFIGSDVAYVYIVTPNQIEKISLANPQIINQTIKNFRSQYLTNHKKTASHFYKNSKKLYELLIEPFINLDILQDKDLVIIPSGQLNYIPFELLISDKQEKGYAQYNYLLLSKNISYYPSATQLVFN